MRIGLVVNPRIEAAVGESHNIIEFLKDKVELFITDELNQLVGETYNDKSYSVAPLPEFSEHEIECGRVQTQKKVFVTYCFTGLFAESCSPRC